MSEDLDSISEEERSLFRPFTRESLAAIEARIAEEHAKQKELEKKRAEGEVSTHPHSPYNTRVSSAEKKLKKKLQKENTVKLLEYLQTLDKYTSDKMLVSTQRHHCYNNRVAHTV